jgi:hypothetical protein
MVRFGRLHIRLPGFDVKAPTPVFVRSECTEERLVAWRGLKVNGCQCRNQMNKMRGGDVVATPDLLPKVGYHESTTDGDYADRMPDGYLVPYQDVNVWCGQR